MGRTKGTYTLTSNIEPKVGAPLDARTIVKLLADLTASNTFEYPYRGMRVFVEENNKSYTLVGSDPTVSSNWTEDGSGGGHVIKNQTGTDMNQRSNLQFVDMTLSDDAINDITKVENIHVIQSESELDNLPDGLYMLDDDEGTVIDGNEVGYDNTDSGLRSRNIQDAIDEIVETLDDKIDISTKGVANGVAELDSAGKVPSSQLPSFVDDVIEVADYDHLPATGETGKIYVTLDTNKTYRWGGTEYVEISESLALGETSSTAYAGNKGKQNADNIATIQGLIPSSATTSNKLATASDIPNISGKADKVSGATSGNLAGLNGSGNLTDSGWNGAKDTTSISGNPIAISGLKSNQLAVNPIITLEPIQAGSGTPSPSNIRAISGYDKVEALSCGVNVWDEEWEVGTYDETTGEKSSAIQAFRSKNKIGVIPNGQYYFNITSLPVSATRYPRIFKYAANGDYLGVYNLTSPTLNIASDTAYITFRLDTNYGTTYKNDISINYPATQTTYVASNKATSISESLGQTVYGATWYPRTGKLSNTHNIVDLGDIAWTKSGNEGLFISYNPQSSINLKMSPDNVTPINAVCSHYAIETYSNHSDKSVFDTWATAASKYLAVLDSDYANADATAFRTAMSGVKLCYEVNEPTEIQLTPHEISLLSNYAYVSTNGTNIAFDYHNGELASLADVSQLGETVERQQFHAYSSGAKKIGTWIDGSDVYEEVIVLSGETTIGNTLTNVYQYTGDMKQTDCPIECFGIRRNPKRVFPLHVDMDISGMFVQTYVSGAVIKEILVRFIR